MNTLVWRQQLEVSMGWDGETDAKVAVSGSLPKVTELAGCEN